MEQPISSPECVITLVHGTWAPDAPWTKEGSSLRAKLRNRLGERTVFRTFTWSGRNSHLARLQAGVELRSDLEASIAHYPNAKQFVIAHSHGGNVALYALRDQRLQAWIDGLVTFATPFLSCRPRDLGTRFALLGVILPGFAMTIVFPFCAGVLVFAGFLIQQLLPRAGFVFGVVFVLELVVLLALIAEIWQWMRRVCEDVLFPRAEERQQRVLERLSVPDALETPILCLRFQGDEAGSWLGALHWVTRIPAVASLGAQRVLRPMFMGIGAFGGLTLLALAAFGQNVSIGGQPVYELVPTLYLVILGTLTQLFLLLQVWIVLAPKLARSHPLGFGPEAMLDHWVAEIGVHDRPTCTAYADVRVFSPVAAARRIGLRGVLRHLLTDRVVHSAIYHYEPSLAAVADWVAER
jgi:hypothetical protein